MVDAWVAQREAESKVTSVGYMIHLKHIKSRAIYAALIQNTGELLVTILHSNQISTSSLLCIRAEKQKCLFGFYSCYW